MKTCNKCKKDKENTQFRSLFQCYSVCLVCIEKQRLIRKYKRTSNSARRAALLKQRTPKWLSKLDMANIKFIYNNCPAEHHVDHITPLNGEMVSGLHVPWNLQYLSASQNMKKGNKCL